MITLLSSWYKDRFSDPQAVTLLLILVGVFLVLYFAAGILAPLLVALILAFLLDWPVTQMERIGLNRSTGASIVLFMFVGLVLMIVLGIIPSVWRQGGSLVTELPNMLDKGLMFTQDLAVKHPEYISTDQVNNLIGELKALVDTEHLLGFTKQLIGYSASLLALMVYAILVPLMVFFFLKDKESLLRGSKRFFPSNRQLAGQVWAEMHQQIFNYIRGKVIELFAVGIVTYVFFAFMDLQYAALLGVLTGLSVLIPFFRCNPSYLTNYARCVFSVGY